MLVHQRVVVGDGWGMFVCFFGMYGPWYMFGNLLHVCWTVGNFDEHMWIAEMSHGGSKAPLDVCLRVVALGAGISQPRSKAGAEAVLLLVFKHWGSKSIQIHPNPSKSKADRNRPAIPQVLDQERKFVDRLIRDKDGVGHWWASRGAPGWPPPQEGLEQSTGRLQEQLAKARLRHVAVSWLVYMFIWGFP